MFLALGSMERRNKEVFAPIRGNKKLIWIHLCTNSHPVIILRVHLPQTFQLTKVWWQVLAKMRVIGWSMLIEIFEEWLEKIGGVVSLRNVRLLGVILEKIDVKGRAKMGFAVDINISLKYGRPFAFVYLCSVKFCKEVSYCG